MVKRWFINKECERTFTQSQFIDHAFKERKIVSDNRRNRTVFQSFRFPGKNLKSEVQHLIT